MPPSSLHQRICGLAEQRLRDDAYTIVGPSPIRGFQPDVQGRRGRAGHYSHVALVEVEAISKELWGNHTEGQLRRMASYVETSDGMHKLVVLAVPTDLRSEAVALKLSMGFRALKIWAFPS